MRDLVKGLTPPLLWSAAERMRRSADRKPAHRERGEKDAAWYDQSFEKGAQWKEHYTASRYYFLWTVIDDRIRHAGVRSVLEVACGPGQLASLLADHGLGRYCGFDFSGKRIEQARVNRPDLEFLQADAFTTDLFDKVDYDCVVCTEFLEHVERDLEVIDRIRPGTRFYGTVPNFLYESHVRCFANVDEVAARYGSRFRDLRVDPFLGDAKGKTYFLLDGVKA